MTSTPPQGLLLLTKTPGHAPVKTRLAEDIGREQAEALYTCFLQDIGARCRRLKLPLHVFHHPGLSGEIRLLEQLLGPAAGYAPQQGSELGARMLDAFCDSFAAGTQALVLIGGDCPDLPQAYLEAAFDTLETHDCVLGPTRDGGYYLIGFRNPGFVPSVFAMRDWAAHTVYAETCKVLQEHGVSWRELPPWEDVDSLADLRRLWERHTQPTADAPAPGQAPATLAWLERFWPHGAA
ncbi:MAG: TIGR04282 family arsenosugar biosynthesis glycosyltransferase [Candidatus Sericytochromatia bacterium]